MKTATYITILTITKTKMKKTLNSILLILMLLVGVGQNAWGQKPGGLTGSTVIASGNLSSTITWELVLKSSSMSTITDEMILNISGTGNIPNYSSADAVPWANVTISSTTKDCREFIKTINVEEGITRIGNRVFNGTAIQKFNIPSSCTVIGLSAFLNCSSLKEIYIPSTVTSIAPSAFNDCSKLSLIHYDGRCTDNTKISPSGLAAKGKIIEEAGTTASLVSVPTGWDYYTHGVKCHSGAWVAESGTKLFFYGQASGAGVDYAASGTVASSSQSNPQYHPWRSNCYKYTSLEINRFIASIADNEFCGYLGSDVSKMGYTNMRTITVESGNANFVVGDDGALYDKNKTKVYLYSAKSTATSIEIPSTVTEIKPGAFYGASKLRGISFLGTINTIGAYSFSQASSLNYLYFATETAPTTTATTAFSGVASEGLVAANANTEAFRTFTSSKVGTNWVFDGSSTGSVRAYVKSRTLYVKGYGAYSTISSSASWYSNINTIDKIVVEEGITNIGSYAFEGCRYVNEVTLNNKGSIGQNAFKNCTVLARVNIGKDVLMFYETSFLGCPNLSDVNITDFASFNNIWCIDFLTNGKWGTAESKTLWINGAKVVPSIGLDVPEGVTSIQNEAIRYFDNVKKINLPSTITKISAKNFLDCKFLEDITLPSSVTSVESSAFENCTRLWQVTLNNKGTIAKSAFKNCTQLGCVNIGSELTGFDDATSAGYPFEGCSKLSTVNIADFDSYSKIKNLKYLTDSSYGTKTGKTLAVNGKVHNSSAYFYIPEGITTYNNGVLSYFSNVKKICLPNSMTAVDGFKNHPYLERVVLRSTVKNVAAGAFANCSALKCITCRAMTAPTVTDSIATNQGLIILKVPYDSNCHASYFASSIWKTFQLVWTRSSSCYMEIHANESKTPEDDLLTTEDVLNWSTDNESIATVDNNGVITGCNTTYDGTTNKFSETIIRADFIECDQLICHVTVIPSDVVLTDKEVYRNSKDFVAERISYTRTYKSSVVDHWQCFYVPFDIEVTDELLQDYDFAKLYVVCYNDKNNNGFIEDNEPLRMFFNKFSAGRILHANMPYYVRVKSAGTKTIEVTNTELKAAANGTVNCSTTEHEYTLVGVYEQTNLKGLYTMGVSGNFSYYTKDSNLNTYRWYMEVKSRTGNGSELENYARPIEIYVDGEDETTGIVALEDKASASKDDKIYTLDGRKVTGVDNLSSGIYIVNGKKVYKK